MTDAEHTAWLWAGATAGLLTAMATMLLWPRDSAYAHALVFGLAAAFSLFVCVAAMQRARQGDQK